MKILLLRDIPKIGKKGDEVEASDGYARNFLIRQNFAVQVGTNVAKILERQINETQKQKEKEIRQQSKLFDKLQNLKLEIEHQANKQGHLFAAVSPQEIVDSLERALHIRINTDKIVIEESIKSIGEHKVFYNLGGKLVSFRVNVKSPEK